MDERPDSTITTTPRSIAGVCHGLCMLDTDGRVRFISSAASQMLGHDARSVIGHDFHSLVHGDHLFAERTAPEPCSLARMLRTGAGGCHDIDTFVRRDGRTFPAAYSLAPLSEQGLLLAFQDLTERMEVEEALRSSEAHYRAVFDTAVDAIVVMTADGAIRSLNHAAERIFDYSAAEAIGRPFVDLIAERFRAVYTSGIRLYLEAGEGIILGRTLEVVGQRKDGGEVPLEMTIAEVTHEKEIVFATILRDITERKQVEAERAALLAAEQEQTRRLRELAALKADFTAMVAHELTSPLSAIRALITMVRSGQLRPEDQANALAVIQTEAEALGSLVVDVQAAAQVERDDFTVNRRPVRLALLIADAAAFARTLPGDHPFTLDVRTNDVVHVDPERIRQVLRNLLGNAAKYSRPGSPIELRAYTLEHRVRIEVSDRGFGIDPADIGRIFEKFGRGRDVSGGKILGSGLGLYLSLRIIQAHGSDIHVESTLGEGSTFSFDLEMA